jgi:glyoxylate/hydroxypyruvate reductase A
VADARDILVASGPWAPEPWAAGIRAVAQGRGVHVWPDVPDPTAVAYALVWHPPQEMLATLPKLRAIFSLGAGVDHFIFQDSLPDVPIVRVIDPNLTQRMTEWVTLQVLIQHRQQKAYDALQAARRWHELPQPTAREVRVGIMGMGVLGRDAAEVLVRLGFRVAGWSRKASSVEGVEAFAGAAGLDAFLARTDILVCLLPLTDETRGIMSMPLFRKLASDGALGAPALVNAGRGGLQVEADIVAALDEGVLGGASLDVFQVEPLPATSPLWTHPKVTITPHAAAYSVPEALVRPILAQIEAFEAGKPLANVVDRRAQY